MDTGFFLALLREANPVFLRLRRKEKELADKGWFGMGANDWLIVPVVGILGVAGVAFCWT